MPETPLLVINTGSSSLKLGMYVERAGDEALLWDGLADGIGQAAGTLTLREAGGKTVQTERLRTGATEGEALQSLVGWLRAAGAPAPAGVGHRIVHGGPRLQVHQKITAEVMMELEGSVDFAPLHLPVALELIRGAERAFAGVPQFGCFDTAFHAAMPERAKRLALPRALYDEGIRRYGFHGLSYESIVHALGAGMPARTVVAHLGNGASLCAMAQGRSVWTSMGLTPTGGVPMGTRSGDLDPGAVLFLMRQRRLEVGAMEAMLDRESGLKGISGGRSDLRDLQAAAATGDGAAAMAIEMFCGAIARTVAGYAVELGGLDMLVFTGGIGEHSAAVRGAVAQRLRLLDVVLDDAHNQAGAETISAEGSRVKVRAMASEEDRQIARHTRQMLLDLTRKT